MVLIRAIEFNHQAMTNTPFLASLPPDTIDPVQAQLLQSIAILGRIEFATNLAVLLLMAAFMALTMYKLVEFLDKHAQTQ